MRTALLTLATTGLIGALFAGTSAQAGQKIPLSAAMAQCDQRSVLYSRTIVDGAANTLGQQALRDHYRTCVYAKSGRYPPQTARPKGLRLSGSAAIGIVISN